MYTDPFTMSPGGQFNNLIYAEYGFYILERPPNLINGLDPISEFRDELVDIIQYSIWGTTIHPRHVHMEILEAFWNFIEVAKIP
jgi:hypothetical protein